MTLVVVQIAWRLPNAFNTINPLSSVTQSGITTTFASGFANYSHVHSNGPIYLSAIEQVNRTRPKPSRIGFFLVKRTASSMWFVELLGQQAETSRGLEEARKYLNETHRSTLVGELLRLSQICHSYQYHWATALRKRVPPKIYKGWADTQDEDSEEPSDIELSSDGKGDASDSEEVEAATPVRGGYQVSLLQVCC